MRRVRGKGRFDPASGSAGRRWRARETPCYQDRAVSVSIRLCQELASLARLSLTDEEAQLFSAQLDPILRYLQQLQAVDVEGIDEAVPNAEGFALRADEPGLRLDREAALSQAAAVRDGHVLVPKIKDDA